MIIHTKLYLVLGAVVVAGATAGVGLGYAVGGGQTSEPELVGGPNTPLVLDSAHSSPADAVKRPPTSSDSPPALGRLAGLEASIDTKGWVAWQQHSYALSAMLPSSFYSDWAKTNMLDGTGAAQRVTFSNYDLSADSTREEGSWPGPGHTWLTATLYPTALPGSQINPTGEELDSTSIDFGAGSARFVQLRRADAPDAVVVSGEFVLPDGSLLVLSGATTSPGSDQDVQSLMGVVKSLEVQ